MTVYFVKNGQNYNTHMNRKYNQLSSSIVPRTSSSCWYLLIIYVVGFKVSYINGQWFNYCDRCHDDAGLIKHVYKNIYFIVIENCSRLCGVCRELAPSSISSYAIFIAKHGSIRYSFQKPYYQHTGRYAFRCAKHDSI